MAERATAWICCVALLPTGLGQCTLYLLYLRFPQQTFSVSLPLPPAVPAMGLLSLLPDEYASVETWLKRMFVRLCLIQHHNRLLTALQFFFGLVMIGPWVFLVIYDLVLYIVRSIAYEVPVVGGRARGKARPRAPSLTERPSGHRRKFSLASRRHPPQSPTSSALSASRTPSTHARWRSMQEETHPSSHDLTSHAE